MAMEHKVSRRIPKVSVGLPVYNAENYLDDSLSSLLSQSYRDFELIISDNASTDATGEICQGYAVKDRRIIYHRNDRNMGIAWNHNRVFHLSSGEFFMWASHDDLRTTDYISQCVAALEADPFKVLAFSEVENIDEEGTVLKRRAILPKTDSQKPHERFRELIRLDYTCEAMYGLIRTAVLKRTGLHGLFPDSDRVLLAELSLHGPFIMAPSCIFYRRSHRYPTRHERVSLFDPAAAGRIAFPLFREFREFLAAINRASPIAYERMHCYLLMLRWVRRNHRDLTSELHHCFDQIARGMLSLLRTIHPI
jgi:glycosyltransferase involved in cell wall biosynthesis